MRRRREAEVEQRLVRLETDVQPLYRQQVSMEDSQRLMMDARDALQEVIDLLTDCARADSWTRLLHSEQHEELCRKGSTCTRPLVSVSQVTPLMQEVLGKKDLLDRLLAGCQRMVQQKKAMIQKVHDLKRTPNVTLYAQLLHLQQSFPSYFGPHGSIQDQLWPRVSFEVLDRLITILVESFERQLSGSAMPTSRALLEQREVDALQHVLRLLNCYEYGDDQPPEDLLCSLSQRLLTDPVILLETGSVFDRQSITMWFNHGMTQFVDPVSAEILQQVNMATCVEKEQAAVNWLKSRNGLFHTNSCPPAAVPPVVQINGSRNTQSESSMDYVVPRQLEAFGGQAASFSSCSSGTHIRDLQGQVDGMAYVQEEEEMPLRSSRQSLQSNASENSLLGRASYLQTGSYQEPAAVESLKFRTTGETDSPDIPRSFVPGPVAESLAPQYEGDYGVAWADGGSVAPVMESQYDIKESSEVLPAPLENQPCAASFATYLVPKQPPTAVPQVREVHENQRSPRGADSGELSMTSMVASSEHGQLLDDQAALVPGRSLSGHLSGKGSLNLDVLPEEEDHFSGGQDSVQSIQDESFYRSSVDVAPQLVRSGQNKHSSLDSVSSTLSELRGAADWQDEAGAYQDDDEARCMDPDLSRLRHSSSSPPHAEVKVDRQVVQPQKRPSIEEEEEEEEEQRVGGADKVHFVVCPMDRNLSADDDPYFQTYSGNSCGEHNHGEHKSDTGELDRTGRRLGIVPLELEDDHNGSPFEESSLYWLESGEVNAPSNRQGGNGEGQGEPQEEGKAEIEPGSPVSSSTPSSYATGACGTPATGSSAYSTPHAAPLWNGRTRPTSSSSSVVSVYSDPASTPTSKPRASAKVLGQFCFESAAVGLVVNQHRSGSPDVPYLNPGMGRARLSSGDSADIRVVVDDQWLEKQMYTGGERRSGEHMGYVVRKETVSEVEPDDDQKDDISSSPTEGNKNSILLQTKNSCSRRRDFRSWPSQGRPNYHDVVLTEASQVAPEMGTDSMSFLGPAKASLGSPKPMEGAFNGHVGAFSTVPAVAEEVDEEDEVPPLAALDREKSKKTFFSKGVRGLFKKLSVKEEKEKSVGKSGGSRTNKVGNCEDGVRDPVTTTRHDTLSSVQSEPQPFLPMASGQWDAVRRLIHIRSEYPARS